MVILRAGDGLSIKILLRFCTDSIFGYSRLSLTHFACVHSLASNQSFPWAAVLIGGLFASTCTCGSWIRITAAGFGIISRESGTQNNSSLYIIK